MDSVKIKEVDGYREGEPIVKTVPWVLAEKALNKSKNWELVPDQGLVWDKKEGLRAIAVAKAQPAKKATKHKTIEKEG